MGAKWAPLAGAAGGSRTVSITWMTPFDVSMSVLTNPAPFTDALPLATVALSSPP